MVYHPVTILRETTQEADALFAAIAQIDGTLLFCYPNADGGSRKLIDLTRAFLAVQGRGQVFINLDVLTYWSLLRQVELMAGNSSSGIMETPSFALPTVNIGLRQKGRERARNILDAEATCIRSNQAEVKISPLPCRDDQSLRGRTRLGKDRFRPDERTTGPGLTDEAADPNILIRVRVILVSC